MIKTITKGLFVVAMLCATTITSMAQTLKVLGTTVSGSVSSISSSVEGCTIEGTVSYDASTKTLLLDNATINAHKPGSTFFTENEEDCIESSIDGLTIRVVGNSKLITGSGAANVAIHLHANATITGDAGHLLTITNWNYDEGTSDETPPNATLLDSDVKLTVSNANILSYCPWAGQGADRSGWAGQGKLEIVNSTMDYPIESKWDTNYSNIAFFDEFTMTDCSFVDPTPETIQYKFDYTSWGTTTTRYVLSADGKTIYRGAVKIGKGGETTAYLKVAGQDVNDGQVTTSDAANQILGNVTFDAETHTLTLDNAVITTSTNAIETDNDLIILLKGDNKIVFDDNAFALVMGGENVTITSEDGTGTLTISNSTMNDEEWGAGFHAVKLGQNTTLTLDNCSLISYEGMIPDLTYRSFDLEYASGNIIVKNANLEFRSELDDDYPVFGYFKSVTLDGSKYEIPADGEYDANEGFVMSEESEYDGYWYTDVKIVRDNDEPQPHTGYVSVAGQIITESTDEVVPTANGSVITSGKVSYDAENKTLTLDNANIVCYIEDEYDDNNTEDGIYSNIDGLQIRLIGENSIFYGWGHGLVFDANTTITSDGTASLYVQTSDDNNTYGDPLLVSNGNTLTLKDAELKIDAPVNFTGDGSSALGGSLNVDNAVLKITESATPGYWGYLINVDNLTLTGTQFIDETAHFDVESHQVVDAAGSRFRGPIIIAKVEDEPKSGYLQVMGQDVSNGTVHTIDGANQIMGDVTFDATTKTLTLDNAIITTNHDAIQTANDLTILLKGDNRIVVDSKETIFALNLTASNVAITSEDGTGTLFVIGSDMLDGDDEDGDLAGFQTVQLGENTTLTIDNAAFVTYEGFIPGDHSFTDPANVGYLVLNNAYFETKTDCENISRNAKGWPTLGYLAGFTLNECKFLTPADGEYDAEESFVMSEELGYEGYYYGVVVVTPDGGVLPPQPNAAVYVAGLKLTESVDEVVPTSEGSEITSGKVSYDAETKTLTIDNATIKCYIPDEYDNNNEDAGIENEVEGLTVNLIGENHIVYGWGHGLIAHKDFTLTSSDGTGTLVVSPMDEYDTDPNALVVDKDATFSVVNTTLTLDTPINMVGYYGSGMGGSLVVDNATMEISRNYGYLDNVTSLTLVGTTIYDSEDNELTFDVDKHQVVGSAGSLYRGTIIIKPTVDTPTAIESLNFNVGSQDIYNLKGQQVTGKRLTKGVYIIGGKKVVVK